MRQEGTLSCELVISSILFVEISNRIKEFTRETTFDSNGVPNPPKIAIFVVPGTSNQKILL